MSRVLTWQGGKQGQAQGRLSSRKNVFPGSAFGRLPFIARWPEEVLPAPYLLTLEGSGLLWWTHRGNTWSLGPALCCLKALMVPQ